MDVDEGLVRRLESTSVRASIDLVDSIKALDPSTAAESRELLDGVLIAMGRDRYVNRAIGVTMNALTAHDVDEIESFFVQRRLPPMVELSSWAPASTLAELGTRNYAPTWFRSVFALQPDATTASTNADVRIESVEDDDAERWLAVFNRGFEAEHGELRVANDEIGRASRAAPASLTFLAFVGDVAAGCGSVQVVDGVAWLGGAATVPAFRRRGVQAALVAHRLRVVADLGCELAAVSALCNGPSARNIVRFGFQHIHTQVVVQQKATFGAGSPSE
jgi:GNAT superfamily N-acetyltransferase